MASHKSVWPYIKGYKFNSLLAKNFLYVFLLVTIPLLLVLGLNYKTLTRVVDNRVMEMNSELLQKSTVVTDNIMNNVLQTLDTLVQLDYITEIVQFTDTEDSASKFVKKHIGVVLDYFTKAQVAQVKIQDVPLKLGDKIQIHGNKTGVVECEIKELRRDSEVLEIAEKGDWATFPCPRVRVGDKVFILAEREMRR